MQIVNFEIINEPCAPEYKARMTILNTDGTEYDALVFKDIHGGLSTTLTGQYGTEWHLDANEQYLKDIRELCISKYLASRPPR